QMRTRKTRDFGDRRLFEWLASPERRWLWDGADKGEDNDCGREDRDCLTAFIAQNEHLADQPKSITWTQVDPVKHPVWPFFGENSAVEYWLTREETSSGDARLVLVLKQLLARQADGSYSAVDRVKIALRGYDDFERSFALPDNAGDVSAKQTLVFRDDLLGGQTRQGTLSGMKLTWERDELEASHQKRQPTKKSPRIYANFSCDAGEAALPDWLTKHVGSDVKLKKPRDGMTRAFFLKKAISKDGATEDGGTRLPPGQRQWPKEAIDHGFTVRGTDLGYRTSSAGALWRLSFTKPDGKTAWQVGKCEGKPVYAVLERTSAVSLPGDGEALPTEEQALRERLYSLRTRLNLNNSLLRITRLLALEAITQRKPDGAKVRKRADGITKRIGTKWKTETRSLDEPEIKENCRKVAEQLVRWASTDAMTESLKAIGHTGSIWDWLGNRNASLKALAEKVPTTEVPTEKQAKKQGIDRDAAKTKRQAEDDEFAGRVHQLRMPLAKSLCDGYDAEKCRRATSGLWNEFDAALMREVSYGDRGDNGGKRDLFENGLFRLLRRPPVTKHGDRKDDTNNLPHGRTHRGGVSMNRLNFLDDVKNFVRRWSCRPRWPGDVRRVPRDAKVNRGDTEHLDNLREHRAKLIAHADVAQTLGFEQDLRRGLWRYSDRSDQLLWHRPERGHFYREDGYARVQCPAPAGLGDKDSRHPHPAYDPAHVLVYEDLTRYRMSSDRPKNENAGLARWSHRQILAFAQHIGGLFGVPVATVDARFSSRYCSHCGAPGCRAVRFDPAWLNQTWMQRVLQSNDIRDAAMRSVADRVRSGIDKNPHAFDREEDRPWVLRDGGSHFVCANTKCPVHSTPIDADENAAGNVGLRFLRGIDGIRATISGNGMVTRSIGYVDPGTVLVQVGDGEASEREPYWGNGDGGRSRTRTAAGRKGVAGSPAPADDIEDDDESGGVRILFRDPSGGFRSNDRWFEGKVFWGAVARACAAGINATNASRFGSDDDD
ncbi:MAG: type V CRISPR-associated protein Cas12b, partial [Phycisphaerales bacterium]|nr:type V CRISPR-associated protein Cas12b [Phycisphaerales bacterium]